MEKKKKKIKCKKLYYRTAFSMVFTISIYYINLTIINLSIYLETLIPIKNKNCPALLHEVFFSNVALRGLLLTLRKFIIYI